MKTLHNSAVSAGQPLLTSPIWRQSMASITSCSTCAPLHFLSLALQLILLQLSVYMFVQICDTLLEMLQGSRENLSVPDKIITNTLFNFDSTSINTKSFELLFGQYTYAQSGNKQKLQQNILQNNSFYIVLAWWMTKRMLFQQDYLFRIGAM